MAAGFIPGTSAWYIQTAVSRLKDRSKDIIVQAVRYISSIEIEDVLCKRPAVSAAAVVAKPDDKWGETPCAFVELRHGEHATAEALIEWCRTHLASSRSRVHRIC